MGWLVGCCLTFGLNMLGDAVFMTDDPYLYVSIWSFLLSASTTIAVSLVTKPDPPEKLEGLVYGTVVTRSIEPDEGEA